jgi:hypothetical protein
MKIARHITQRTTIAQIASEADLPPGRVQILLDELQQKTFLVVTVDGEVYYPDPVTPDEMRHKLTTR